LNCDPVMFDEYSPRSVGADGNCLYRAASLACYGSENWHLYVRFRTAVHMLSNRPLYDIDSDDFVLKNEPMLTSSYTDLVRDVLKTGHDAEFVHVVALGAALKITIQSYSCPLAFVSNEMHPYTCTIINNQCKHEMQTGHVVLMWTKLHLTSKDPNHFVLLVPRHLFTTNSSASGHNLRSRRVNHTGLQVPVPVISSSSAPVALPVESSSSTPLNGVTSPVAPQQQKRRRRRSPAVTEVIATTSPVLTAVCTTVALSTGVDLSKFARGVKLF
jgi:hypothetical protein